MMLSVVSSRPATRLSFPSHTLVQDDNAQCFPRPEPLSFPAPALKSLVRCFSSRVICHRVARLRSPLSSSRNLILHLKADKGFSPTSLPNRYKNRALFSLDPMAEATSHSNAADCFVCSPAKSLLTVPGIFYLKYDIPKGNFFNWSQLNKRKSIYPKLPFLLYVRSVSETSPEWRGAGVHQPLMS